jgi:16S rRNA (guanine527-N7)-methyltransferase
MVPRELTTSNGLKSVLRRLLAGPRGLWNNGRFPNPYNTQFVTDPTEPLAAPEGPESPPAISYPGDTLAAALARHGLELSPDQTERIDAFCRHLWTWNEKVNLTRHTDYEKFVARDLVDSRQLAVLLEPGEEVLDVGTGNGVPGLVIALLRPDVKVSLIDSVAKKAKIVEQIARDLGLACPVFTGRVEDHLREPSYSSLVARAVGPLEKMLRWFKPHWSRIGRLLAVKGPRWNEELYEANRVGLMRQLHLKQVASYPMSGTDAESVILQIWHTRRKPPGG